MEACRAVVDELHPLAERNKFPWPLSQAHFLRGWLAAKNGDEGGIRQMLESLNQPAAANFRPMLLGLIATEQLSATRHDDAVQLLEQAMNDANVADFLFYKPELMRLRGEALLAQSRDNRNEAEGAFRKAIASAAGQSCRAFELRGVSSLARLLADGGRKSEARELLAPIYGVFTEGFDGADLRAAGRFLDELR